MTPRVHGLTKEELFAIGDPEALTVAVNAELNMFLQVVLGDQRSLYTDDQVHAVIDERLAALPEHGPERTAIQKTYELLLVVIDGGVSDMRSDDELRLWINGDASGYCPGFRPVVDAAPA